MFICCIDKLHHIKIKEEINMLRTPNHYKIKEKWRDNHIYLKLLKLIRWHKGVFLLVFLIKEILRNNRSKL